MLKVSTVVLHLFEEILTAVHIVISSSVCGAVTGIGLYWAPRCDWVVISSLVVRRGNVVLPPITLPSHSWVSLYCGACIPGLVQIQGCWILWKCWSMPGEVGIMHDKTSGVGDGSKSLDGSNEL